MIAIIVNIVISLLEDLLLDYLFIVVKYLLFFFIDFCDQNMIITINS